jgi:hypothetical protein
MPVELWRNAVNYIINDVNYEYIENQEQVAILTGHPDIYSVTT